MTADSGTAPTTLNKTYRLVGQIAGALIYAAAAVIAADVVFRQVGAPIRWPFEVYPYLAFWSALIGFGYVTYLDGNVRMDLLVEEGWLGPFERMQPLFTSLISAVYLLIIVYGGTELVTNLIETGRTTAELRVPLFYHAIAMPLGFGLATVATLIQMADMRRRRGNGVKQ